MPRATANIAETQKFSLKTCIGGYVVVRRLTWGEKIERRIMTGGMQVKTDNRKRSSGVEGYMQFVTEESTKFDFARCIIDHNLEDETGRKLNLGNVMDFRSLDPRIGEEIDSILNDLNNFEVEDENLGNSPTEPELPLSYEGQ